MILRIGDRGPEVKRLQAALGIPADGMFGMQTKRAVAAFQLAHGLVDNGEADESVFRRLFPGDSAVMISERALQLILDYEVGGGEAYYGRKLRRPTWPGGASGVTIGVGYDLGYEGTMLPWKGKLSPDAIFRLEGSLGLKGQAAAAMVPAFRDIDIPWTAALAVFKHYTLPIEIDKTLRAFPGAGHLGPTVLGVLVSLVYNRGGSMVGDSRREMREIRRCVAVRDLAGIADEILSMKRLWPDVKGLRLRRDAEARLVIQAAGGAA